MPISGRWWSFSAVMVDTERDEGGVYELGDGAQHVTYIGSSNQVRRRLREHLGEPGYTCIGKATCYRVEYTPNYRHRERELYDEHVRRHGRGPACNDVRP